MTLCFQKLLVEGTRGRDYNRSLRAKASAVKLRVERLQLPRGSTCCPGALNAHMLLLCTWMWPPEHSCTLAAIL